MDEQSAERLYARAWDRLDRRAAGFGMPILRHLALRGYVPALDALSLRLEQAGPIGLAFTSAGLAYRAWRLGSSIAAYNLAMECFNRGDLAGYRCWLARAARRGDVSARDELKRFEVRKPHTAAASIRRKRPPRRSDW